jgi:alpha-tubulin suppressor-like RCC1 family protein
MSAAIKTDGTLWTWGWNFPGSLGQGLAYINLPARSTPQQVGTATNWKQVSVGGESSGLSGACCAAIKTDGTLWTWGLNSYGQLGDNSRVTKSAPVQEFTSSTNWVQVSMAENHAMAIKNNGTLWGWGRNDNGQLGQRDLIISRSTPRQEFTSSTNWKQVSASPVNTLALKTDGTLWCWGDNFYGQVGDNTRLDRSTPRQVGTATDWKQISSGALYNMAIKTNGSLWFWGRNDFITTGVSGNNDLISRSTPIQVGYETNWKQVSASISVSAVKTGIEMDTGTITT